MLEVFFYAATFAFCGCLMIGFFLFWTERPPTPAKTEYLPPTRKGNVFFIDSARIIQAVREQKRKELMDVIAKLNKEKEQEDA